MSEEFEFKPMSFPPAVVARISPELSLQRHLAIGIRPNLRKFEEFRNIEFNDGGLSRYGSDDQIKNTSVLGSSVLKSGNTTVITTITAGIIEEDLPAHEINDDAAAVNAVFAKDKTDDSNNDIPKSQLDEYESIYPVVEVERGRVGAPTDEEMILSQKLYETFLHSKILSKDSLKVKVGLRSIDSQGKVDIYYKDDDDDSEDFGLGPKRSWKFVLYAKVKVFSRSGPLFDLVWASVLSALQNTKLPRAHIDENAADIKIPVKMRGNHGTIREQYQIICDAISRDPLKLNNEAIGISSNFGIIDIDEESIQTLQNEDSMEIDSKSILLTDIEGEEEEISSKKTISIVSDRDSKNLKSLTIIGNVSNDQLRKSFELTKFRFKHFAK
ncbi:Polyribonucleotide nucleotidyltransferase [Wickerhamomyces ciferrii]|uniref:Ribosomal RNA-processing protein 43 n=1 Tax=Wickerhamomyces ciferrii (strain ATCC 14091 / BCRC 22168 / CBS 111 / JCM 3599 / NBRC 0793 / NRRL Y-1031 F-60-10) TaxID=1206466 RepID=K0KJN6_WICCF|nr:Polyribonucleotide nucleotidyltransferase [Wickerhamomyces ciferrii]CCH42347.1 Polyribonucleotide nucleotidyltransferase [Wickerhamomyces ciferrii]